MERAFRLTGLTTGALHNVVTSNIVDDSPAVWSLEYGREERNQMEQALGKKQKKNKGTCGKTRYMYKEEKGRTSVGLDV